MRPIVVYAGSIYIIGYIVSQALAELMVPMVGKTKYHVQNAKQIADELKDLKLDEDDMFVSHDQSINQFYFLLSTTSSMPLALYNGTHTLF